MSSCMVRIFKRPTPPWLKLLGVFLVNFNSKGIIFSLNCWSHNLKRVSADPWSPAYCFNEASFVIIVFCLTKVFYMMKVICSPLSSFHFIFLVVRLRCSILPSVGWCSFLLGCLSQCHVPQADALPSSLYSVRNMIISHEKNGNYRSLYS